MSTLTQIYAEYFLELYATLQRVYPSARLYFYFVMCQPLCFHGTPLLSTVRPLKLRNFSLLAFIKISPAFTIFRCSFLAPAVTPPLQYPHFAEFARHTSITGLQRNEVLPPCTARRPPELNRPWIFSFLYPPSISRLQGTSFSIILLSDLSAARTLQTEAICPIASRIAEFERLLYSPTLCR